MPEWATPLLGVFVGGSLTGFFTLWALRWQLTEAREHRREDALRERREKGAAVISPVRALLGDVNPDYLMFFGGSPDIEEDAEEVWQRWLGLRDPLLIYAAGHPASEVGELASVVADAVSKTLINLAYLIGVLADDQAHANLERSQASLSVEYADAVAKTDQLLRLMREEAGDDETRGALTVTA